MTKLTRSILTDGSLRDRLALPSHLSWTDAQLEASLLQLLTSRPSEALWIFAYGSLIWNPLMPFEEHQDACLNGWRRSFCIRTISARGTPENPGRVLGLERGGQTHGVAYKLPGTIAVSELRLLWAREMGSGVYLPIWETLQLSNGETVVGIVFIANPDQPLYEVDTSASTVARLAARAAGVFGTNVEYIDNLFAALQERNMADEYLSEIVQYLAQGSEPQM